MRLNLALIGLPLFLGACGLPPTLSAASWALDGVSYIVSGKSVSDHAISEVAQKDCALLRVVQGRELCDEYADDGDNPQIMVAAAPSGDNWQSGDAIETPEDPFVVPVEVAALVQGFGPGTVDVNETAPAAGFAAAPAKLQPVAVDVGRFVAAAPKARPVFVKPEIQTVAFWAPAPAIGSGQRAVSVVGSFQSISNAWKEAERFAEFDAQVRSMRMDGQTWHRVVVDAPLTTVQRMGVRDAWILTICDIDRWTPPCGPGTVSSAGVIGPQVASADQTIN
ncbi:MAG: hypothetical protein CL566_06540 [Alphaproteobacteria bacterium]|nr:hypothetical protein [Alphaproteobacteria bacterium]